MQSYVLQITSCLPLCSFVYFIRNSKKNRSEIFLGYSLLVVFLCSQLFWYNPIRHSIIHKIDAIVAKTSIGYSIFYTVCMKKLPRNLFCSYLMIVFAMGVTFYASNYYSTKEWCCSHHIFYHFLLHLCGNIGTKYVFYSNAVT